MLMNLHEYVKKNYCTLEIRGFKVFFEFFFTDLVSGSVAIFKHLLKEAKRGKCRKICFGAAYFDF